MAIKMETKRGVEKPEMNESMKASIKGKKTED